LAKRVLEVFMKRFIIIMGGIVMAASMLASSGCEWGYRGDGGRYSRRDYDDGYYRYGPYERNDRRAGRYFDRSGDSQ